MRPLTPGSLRAHLFRLLHGRAILEGKPVLLTSEQLRGAFPRGREQHPHLPEDYGVADVWLLTGDNDLAPASAS